MGKKFVVRTQKMSRRQALGTIGAALGLSAAAYMMGPSLVDKLEKLGNTHDKQIPEGYYIQFSSNLNKKYAENNKQLLHELGFEKAIISEQKIGSKTHYKTLIGLYQNQENAVRTGEKIIEQDKLVDLLGFPEINVIKLEYEKGNPKTDWSGTILIKKDVEPLKDQKKLRAYSNKKINTSEGKKTIDDLIKSTVNEWNHKNAGHDIDTELIKAMVWVESRYKHDKTGYKLKHIGNGKFTYRRDKNGNRIPSAYGLMQLTENAAKEVGYAFEEIKDPAKNLEAGVKYFGKYLNHFKGDIDRTLGAYNAGPTRAMQNKHLNYTETRNYIKKVNKQKEFYKNQKP